MIDADGYELKTYRVVWYAELGWIDGGAMGFWQETKESHPFRTKGEAQAFLDNHPEVHVVTFGGGWTEQRPKWSMGKCRVQMREELIEGGR